MRKSWFTLSAYTLLPLTLLLTAATLYGQDDEDSPEARRDRRVSPELRERARRDGERRVIRSRVRDGDPRTDANVEVEMRRTFGPPERSRYSYSFNGDRPEDRRARELAERYRDTDNEEEREELRDALERVTRESFEQRMDQRRRQIQQMRRELEELTEQLERREELSDQIIDRRISDLLNEPDPLNWDMGPMPGQRRGGSIFDFEWMEGSTDNEVRRTIRREVERAGERAERAARRLGDEARRVGQEFREAVGE